MLKPPTKEGKETVGGEVGALDEVVLEMERERVG